MLSTSLTSSTPLTHSQGVGAEKHFPLTQLPPSLMGSILTQFCTIKDIDILEKTVRDLKATNIPLYNAVQSFWVTKIARINIATIASHGSAIDPIRGKILYKIYLRKIFTETVSSSYCVKANRMRAHASPFPETFFQDPRHYLDNPILTIKVKNGILKANRIFLNRFRNTLECNAAPEARLSPANFLTSRRKNNPLKWILSQLRSQEDKLNLRPGLATIASLADDALEMILQTQEDGHTELFTLLHEYRMSYTQLGDDNDATAVNTRESFQKFNNLLLLKAVKLGRTEILKVLMKAVAIDQIAKAVNINVIFSAEDFPANRTPTMMLIAGKSPLKIAIENVLNRHSDDLSTVTALIDSRADVNFKAHNDSSLVQTALCYGDIGQDATRKRIVKILLNAKAEINAVNSSHDTALFRAISFTSAKLFEFFLNQGPNVHHISTTGKTPLMVAASTKGCLKKLNLLLAPRTLSIIVCGKKSTRKMRKSEDECKQAEEGINSTDKKGYTALMHAVEATNPKVVAYVERLLNAKADVSLRNNAGETALMIAERRLLSDSVITMLTESECPKNKAENKGKKRGHPDDMTVKNSSTPKKLSLSSEGIQENVASFLMSPLITSQPSVFRNQNSEFTMLDLTD